MFRWYREVTPVERRTFWACFGGWALDALDVQMFSLAIPALIAAFAITLADVGLISSVTLISTALGGWIAGALSDRYGRVRVLRLAIVWFSVFTGLSALSQSYGQLLAIKALQGFGVGGEWAAGAVLMGEMIRAEHRGKALGMVQSAWAWGWGGAVALYAVLLSGLSLAPSTAWRVMFGVGIVPALLVIFIQRSVPEPARSSVGNRPSGERAPLFGIFAPEIRRVTLIGGLLGMGAHGGYYALMTWIPTYLKTERKLSVMGTTGSLSVIIVAFWCGCMASGYLQDRIGRRRNILLFALCCVATVLIYLFVPLSPRAMMVAGFPLGFFAAGIPATMGALFNELFPGGIRGTGVGFCYNFGRIVSALFPYLVGYVAKSSVSLGHAIGIFSAIAYGIVVLSVLALPETRGRALGTAPAALPRPPGSLAPRPSHP